MRFWLAVPFLDPANAVEYAVVADGCGYHGVTVSHHLFYPKEMNAAYPYSSDGSPRFTPDSPFPDPWVLIGAMAARTTNLRFTTNVYVAPMHDLFTVAKAVSTAAVLSDNRVAMGVGAGWCSDEFEQTGQDFATRGKRLDEMMDVLPKLWTGDWVEHHGPHFDFGPVKISPAPTRPIPIYVGGDSAPAIRRATQRGDGWIGVDYPVDEAETKVKEVLAARGGRAPFEIILAVVAMPEPDLIRRFADLGVTGWLCAPQMLNPDDPVGEIRRFGEEVVDALR